MSKQTDKAEVKKEASNTTKLLCIKMNINKIYIIILILAFKAKKEIIQS